MASGTGTAQVTGHILSTVLPGSVTGAVVHELTGVDLALKLHYLRAVYYFRPSKTIESLGIQRIKDPFYFALDVYPQAAGRIRRDESGQPHIKCNDSGVRIVEARCEKTVEEWLKREKIDRSKNLVYNKAIGPEINISPLVYVQFTTFKCGGLAVGVSWAHVLGDAVSASNCINLWGHLLDHKPPPKKPQYQHKQRYNKSESPFVSQNPLSTKKVEPVGDFWQSSTHVQMATFSIQINETKIKHLQTKITSNVPAFEAISAFIWQSLARIRVEKEPDIVTVIRNDTSEERNCVVGNIMRICTVSSGSSVAKLNLSDLATLVSNNKEDEKNGIEEMIEKKRGKEDYIVYGANLTFVDMQSIKLYGLELNGQKPAHVDYSIHGVGEEGTILVLPSPNDEAGKGGRVVTVILPEDEIPKLKEALESELSTV